MGKTQHFANSLTSFWGCQVSHIMDKFGIKFSMMAGLDPLLDWPVNPFFHASGSFDNPSFVLYFSWSWKPFWWWTLCRRQWQHYRRIVFWRRSPSLSIMASNILFHNNENNENNENNAVQKWKNKTDWNQDVDFMAHPTITPDWVSS